MSTGEALGQVAEVEPTVIVYDLGMPLDDGYAFVAKLRAHHDYVAARIPSHRAEHARATRGSAAGANGGSQMHLAKPVNLDALTAAVAALSGRSPES
jgi:CheY-like chemotaxis protein